MSSYLFNSEGLVALARYVTPDTLFAFDLDGTLAPIVEDYKAARVADPTRITLARLIELVKVAVITGRSREDALAILGFEPHLLVGNHGAEWPSQDSKRNWQFARHCLKWRDRLFDMLFNEQGIEIEFKGESLSLHYRYATDRENALKRINAAIEQLAPRPKKIGGKLVVNLVPMEAFTKGEALISAMELFGSTRAIYFGDDETDEEVFLLRAIDVFGIHIGKNDQTVAPYYLSGQSEVLGLLNSMVGILETCCNVGKTG
ncbi:trehalose-phosphatase [Geobacter argillaceus]|uniref:Trehalose 6-phosphate phosphatase n=1 Tax=Geobacter argillaceus TaxID=345631 RepID=A0A562WVB3_9BACT|nr:trehalose-phosphatase [Geobacter argillaceus]TWJ33619.1 trehalose 6-phosphatase [Geobacter argillaceus]